MYKHTCTCVMCTHNNNNNDDDNNNEKWSGWVVASLTSRVGLLCYCKAINCMLNIAVPDSQMLGTAHNCSCCIFDNWENWVFTRTDNHVRRCTTLQWLWSFHSYDIMSTILWEDWHTRFIMEQNVIWPMTLPPCKQAQPNKCSLLRYLLRHKDGKPPDLGKG